MFAYGAPDGAPTAHTVFPLVVTVQCILVIVFYFVYFTSCILLSENPTSRDERKSERTGGAPNARRRCARIYARSRIPPGGLPAPGYTGRAHVYDMKCRYAGAHV